MKLPEKFENFYPPVEHLFQTKRGYYRTVLLEKKGTFVPQHVHDWSHDTLVGSGRARGWCDGEWIGDKGPGEVFEIEAGKEHVFMSLEDGTRLSCIHNLNGEPYRILRETHLEKA